MEFQKKVVLIAAIFLIITLIIFGIVLYNRKYVTEYPPAIAECPDYWVNIDGTCVNQKNLGKDTCEKEMNFTQEAWTGDDSMCLKQKWAKGCDLTWDGITNNNNACNSS